MIQPTTLMVSSPYRRLLSVLPVPWETIQLNCIAFPTQRYSFSVILDEIFHSGHCTYVYVFPNSYLQEIRSFSDDSKVFPLFGS